MIPIEGFRATHQLGMERHYQIDYYPSKEYDFSNEKECKSFVRTRFASFYKTNTNEELILFRSFEEGILRRLRLTEVKINCTTTWSDVLIWSDSIDHGPRVFSLWRELYRLELPKEVLFSFAQFLLETI